MIYLDSDLLGILVGVITIAASIYSGVKGAKERAKKGTDVDQEIDLFFEQIEEDEQNEDNSVIIEEPESEPVSLQPEHRSVNLQPEYKREADVESKKENSKLKEKLKKDPKVIIVASEILKPKFKDF